MTSAVLVAGGPPGLRCSRRPPPRRRPPRRAARRSPESCWPAALLAAVYPHVFTHPTLLVQSARQSASFRDNDGAGYLYVPFHLVTQFPLLLQGLAAVGLWARRWSSGRGTGASTRRRSTRLALVVAQVTALPLVAVAKNSDLYNGLRQLLFASPAWAVLVTLGLAQVLAWAPLAGLGWSAALAAGRARRADSRPGRALPLPVQLLQRRARCDGCPRPVRLLAHQRPGAAAGHPDGRPDRLRADPVDPARCARRQRRGARRGRGGDAGRALLLRQQRRLPHRPTRPAVLGVDRAWGCRTTTRFPTTSSTSSSTATTPCPRNCTQLASVTRHRHWREVAMTYVARCRLAPRPLDATVAFTHPDGREHGPAAVGLRPRGLGHARQLERHRRGRCRREPHLPAAGRLREAACALVLDADAPQRPRGRL